MNNLILVKPDAMFEETFKTGYAELTVESDQHSWIYAGQQGFQEYFEEPFSEFVRKSLESQRQGFVRDTVYWAMVKTITGESEMVGRISIRHELNDFLRLIGGHIGFVVKPSARGKGVATVMLQQVLLTDRAKSIRNLLVTCDEGNIASEKTIKRCGGQFENMIEIEAGKPAKKRFWINL